MGVDVCKHCMNGAINLRRQPGLNIAAGVEGDKPGAEDDKIRIGGNGRGAIKKGSVWSGLCDRNFFFGGTC